MKVFLSAKDFRDMLDRLLQENMSLENLHIAFHAYEDEPLLFPSSGVQHHFVLVDEDGEQLVVDSATRPEVRMNTIVFEVGEAADLPSGNTKANG